MVDSGSGYRRVMRQLLPDPRRGPDVKGPGSAELASTVDAGPAVDPVALYRGDERPGTVERPWLALNMVTSLDGATAVDGASADLSSPTDKTVFRTLRAVSDVILVGAGTWRTEGYRPPRTTEADQQWRISTGRPPHPRIAVVSGRLNLDLSLPFFADSPTRPIVITTGRADRDRRRALAEVADVIVAGDESLDIADGLGQLGAAGARVVVGEGGPTLNASLLAADLIDEFCLTLAPLLAGGPSDRAIVGPPAIGPGHLRLDRAIEDTGFLLLRYVRDR